jgi:gas vesicle protein
MALIKRLAKFGLGIATGGAIGAAVGTLTAPDEGESLRRRVKQHFADAKQAGEDAKARAQANLITKYRQDVGNFDALDAVVDHSQSRTDAMLAMGLGLNAPGAIAAKQAAHKDDA